MKSKSKNTFPLFLAILIATGILASTSLGGTAYWDTSWSYRKQLVITNNVGTTLYDYSLMITLNTAELISQGKMQSDCGDIRIIENGIAIDYGIRNPNSASTEIYFIANDLIAGVNEDIYIYYGNPSANNGFVANWKDAFYLWYDDFDTDRGWYDVWGRGGYYTVSGGHMYVHFSPYNDVAWIPADGSYFPMDNMPGLKAEAKMEVTNCRLCQAQIVLGGWDLGSGGFQLLHLSCGHHDYAVGYTGRLYHPVATNTGYIGEFVYNRLTGDWHSKLKNASGDVLESVTGNRPALETDDYSTIIVSSCNGTDPRVDYIYLRYFIEPEPSYSLGEEEYAVIEVDVDIKPGSCPNPLNVKSKGVLPVAILGTEEFDVTTIDVLTIELAGVEPNRSSFEDVATPADGDECECNEDGSDGFMDLTLKFDTQEIVQALGEVNDGDVLPLTLTGMLQEAFDETPIEGADCVRIIAKGKRVKTLPDLVVTSVEPGSINAEGELEYAYTVANIGGEGPSGNSTFDVAAYLSTDSLLDASDIELVWGYSVWTYHLSMGWSQSMSDSALLDQLEAIPSGDYYLIILADAKPGQPPNYYPGVVEANEDNNWTSSSAMVTIP